MKIINSLSQYIPGLRIIHYDGHKHISSRELYNKGIKCCEYCGYLMPTEITKCKCGNDAIVIVDDLMKYYLPDYVVGEVKSSTVIELKRCKRCKQMKALSEFIVRYSRKNKNMYNSSCNKCVDILRANRQNNA